MNAGVTQALNDHEEALSEHQQSDFRSANIFQMVADRVIPGTVMDVGAGGGGMVAWLLENGYDARGIDISESTAAAAQRYLESRGLDPQRVQQQALDELIERGETVDNVISMDCLEHIEDDREAFKQIVDLVRPGGRIVITVPALMAVFGDRDEKQGHYRRYHRDTLLALTEGLPVKVKELRYWNILGVGPVYVNHRILKRSIDESFRYGKPSLKARVLRKGLGAWFKVIENNLRPPFGLTLIMTVDKDG
jgi:SAM-dependent methyltransferase